MSDVFKPLILFKLATRSRPHKFIPCLINIYEKQSDKENFHILCAVDADDQSMYPAIREAVNLPFADRITIVTGKSQNKIHAINRDMDLLFHWQILVNTSDDVEFIYNGFDEEIRKDMLTNFPDLDGMLNYNDGNQADNCMTVSIMGWNYFILDECIYAPQFESLWCDVVAMEVAQIRGKYKYMGHDKMIFRHNHPSFGKADYDYQYRVTESFEVRQRDYNTYLELKKEYDPENKFPIRSI